MFYKHGNYRHANNEVEFISQSADKVYSATGVYLGTHRVWQLKGRIHAANAAALTSAIQALQAAYAIDGVDTGLYCDDGTPTAHVLRAALGLIRVTQPPAYPEGSGGQYTTYRDYQITVESDMVEANGTVSDLWEYRESMSFGGGGTDFVIRVPRTGKGQRQQATECETFTCVQSGHASGPVWPNPPSPRWPEHCHPKQARVVYEEPVFQNGRWKYTVTWMYPHECVDQLLALPANPS